MKLLALSIRQPFATAIMLGQKTDEYRTWKTNHRGPLAIHASNTLRRDAFDEYPHLHPDRVRRGVILGVVDVLDCQEEPYGDGFAWVLGNPRWLASPVPWKGAAALFHVDIEPPG